MKLVWDLNRSYTVGVDRGVLYLADQSGIAWPGLVSVVESQHADTMNKELYFDGVRYNITTAQQDLDLAVSAYTYPPQFEVYDGLSYIESLQQRKTFGFSYRVMTDTGYELHLVYNAIAGSSETSWKTLGGPVTANLMAWEFNSVPPSISGSAPSAHIIIDSTDTYSVVLSQIETILYGSASTAPRLPSIQEVLGIYSANPRLIITDHGDGTWTASGPDDVITVNADGSFQITWPMIIFVASDTYELTTS